MHLLVTIKTVEEKTIWAGNIFDCGHIKLYTDYQKVVYFIVNYGCATNFLVDLSCTRTGFPEVFPSIAEKAAAQSNDAVGPFNRPVHTGLF